MHDSAWRNSSIYPLLWPLMWRAWQHKTLSSSIDWQAPLFSSGEAQAEWTRSRRRIVSVLFENWAHLVFSPSLNFEVKQDNGWHGARVASARVDSQSQSIKVHQTLLAWLDRERSMAAACEAHYSSLAQPTKPRVIPSDVKSRLCL